MSVCPSVLLCPIRFSNSAVNITMRRISSLKSPNPFFQGHLPPPAPTYWIIWPQVRIQEKGGGGWKERNCINRVPSPPLISPATKKVFFCCFPYSFEKFLYTPSLVFKEKRVTFLYTLQRDANQRSLSFYFLCSYSLFLAFLKFVA